MQLVIFQLHLILHTCVRTFDVTRGSSRRSNAAAAAARPPPPPSPSPPSVPYSTIPNQLNSLSNRRFFDCNNQATVESVQVGWFAVCLLEGDVHAWWLFFIGSSLPMPDQCNELINRVSSSTLTIFRTGKHKPSSVRGLKCWSARSAFQFKFRSLKSLLQCSIRPRLLYVRTAVVVTKVYEQKRLDRACIYEHNYSYCVNRLSPRFAASRSSSTSTCPAGLYIMVKQNK